jgi:uncharacterized protein YbjQ (UPF0145 family)
MKARLLVALATASIGTIAHAGDKIETYPVKDVIEDPQYAEKLAGVTFYFGSTRAPAVIRSFGETRTNKKTNGFGKSHATSCHIVMASALIGLAADARARGGDAVINIKSNFKNNLTVSNTDFTCGVGALISGVALVGEVVKTR